jgi:hypothetical protein
VDLHVASNAKDFEVLQGVIVLFAARLEVLVMYPKQLRITTVAALLAALTKGVERSLAVLHATPPVWMSRAEALSLLHRALYLAGM